MSIMRRWFPTVEEEQEEVHRLQQQAAFSKERVTEFLNTAYLGDFKKWLAKSRRSVEPHVGEPSDMIYRTGLRDGIRMVEDFLEDIERSLKEN